MKNYIYLLLLLYSFYSAEQNNTATVADTLGLIDYQIPNSYGYVLFSPIHSFNTYLINKRGEKVHEWNSNYCPGLSVFLLPDGSLLKTKVTYNKYFPAMGGAIEKLDWNGNLLWSYILSDSTQCLNHDIIPLPNGNIIALVTERCEAAQLIAKGKDPKTLTTPYFSSLKIIEIHPAGKDSATIVWEWKLLDHTIQEFDAGKLNYGVISEHPELVNINYIVEPNIMGAPHAPGIELPWINANSIDYNPLLNQLLVSAKNLNEIWIIDHSTTTAQAASHTGGNSGKGGDLLYRWGNPETYNRGTPADKKLFAQHHATWISQGFPNEGKILIFNNGWKRPEGEYSSVDMIETPVNSQNQYTIGDTAAFLPLGLFWEYTSTTPTDFYSNNMGGVYPLQNGSFMITDGMNGTFFEINNRKKTVWKYTNPVFSREISAPQPYSSADNRVFRCNFYPLSYPAFKEKKLNSPYEIIPIQSVPK